jgi:hypothetical protein
MKFAKLVKCKAIETFYLNLFALGVCFTMAPSSKLLSIQALPIIPGRTLNGGTVLVGDAAEELPSRTLSRSAHLRGQISMKACTRCAERAQHFGECVILVGYLQGKCTNCHWAQNGIPCVFPTVETQQTTSPGAFGGIRFRPDTEPNAATWALELQQVDVATGDNDSVSSPITVWGDLSTEEYLQTLRGERQEYVGRIEELDAEIEAAEAVIKKEKKKALADSRSKKRKWKGDNDGNNHGRAMGTSRGRRLIRGC